ncbi:MAG: putative toxin-antitoxin system toxin component, PIN family [Pseudoxanthomonas sp.]
MRVVIDTNVLLSALMTRGGTSDKVYQAWREGRFELVSASAQLTEIRRVSRYSKLRPRLQAHQVGTLVNQLRHTLLPGKLPALPTTLKLDDPDDAFLAQMALACEADWLLTGDRRAGLLELGSIGRTRIATPAVFIREAIDLS